MRPHDLIIGQTSDKRLEQDRFRRRQTEFIHSLSTPDIFRKLVLYEDNHLLVLNKPVGIATMGASVDEASLFTLAQNYIKVKYQKPGAVYLGVVSRIDLPVSGVVVFARTSKSASRLNEQFKNHSVNKIYQALLEGALQYPDGELCNIICEDQANRRLWIPRDVSDLKRLQRYAPKEARLKYQTLKHFQKSTLVEVELLTGRKHQIRLQFSNQGTPIIGDGKYGARPILQPGICLHACKLSLEHPTTHENMTFESQRPEWWEHIA